MNTNVLTLPQWLDRCTMRLGSLLPAMDPTEVARRADAIAGDAYPLPPEHAAEVYLELPNLPVEELCDHEKFDFPTWTLGYRLDDGSSGSALALQAAAAVFEAQGVNPVAGMKAQFKLECWDDSGLAEELELSDEERRAQRVCTLASRAADAADNASSRGRSRGHLVMQSPSNVRWEAARARWLTRRQVNS